MGHNSRRLELLGGWSPQEGESIQLNTRMNLHSLTDPPYGYPSLLQLQFFSLKGRYFIEQNQFRLNEFVFINALSLSRFHLFEPRLSWSMQLGMRERQRVCNECLVGYVEFRTGITVASLSERVSWVIFADSTLEGGKSVTTKVPLTLGLGGSTGLRLEFSKNAVFMGTIQNLYWFFEKDVSTRARGVMRWGILKNLAFTVDAKLLSANLSLEQQYLLTQPRWQLDSGLSIYF